MTLSGGVVEAIAPGGYGSLTITKAISILNKGVGTVGIFPPSGGNAITINAGPTDQVVIEGLEITGGVAGNGSGNGISFNTGVALIVMNCAFDGLDNAVQFVSSSGDKYHIENSSFVNSSIGMAFFPTSGTPTFNGVIRNSTFHNNGTGVEPQYPGATSIDFDTFDGNAWAIYTLASSVVYLSRSNLTNITYGVYNVSGTVYTYGDNRINANTALHPLTSTGQK